MVTPDYVKLMASYAHWQNESLTHAADGLDDAARRLDRGAFFASIHATLNHLLWGDQLWLHRLAGTPAPRQSDIPGSVTTHDDWDQFKVDRAQTDRATLDWSARVSSEMLEGSLSWYSGAVGCELTRPRWALVLQFFNHGTHHRGQVHSMLTAAGAHPADTDVPFMPSDFYPWPE